MEETAAINEELAPTVRIILPQIIHYVLIEHRSEPAE